jgi:hypothetical protein
MALIPILPKRLPLNPEKATAAASKFLHDFERDFKREIAPYPPERPWKNPPKTGPRAGGRRTGKLAQGWTRVSRFSKSTVTIRNPVPYAVHVEGPRRTRVAEARGWPRSLRKPIGERIFNRHRAALNAGLAASK